MMQPSHTIHLYYKKEKLEKLRKHFLLEIVNISVETNQIK
jgi:hypothetical protein